MRAAYLTLATVVAIGACSSNGQDSGASPSPSPNASMAQFDTTNASPQNCIRKTDDFRYYDLLNKRVMPWIQSYTPYPAGPLGATNPLILWYAGLPSGPPVVGAQGPPTPVAIEIPPGASPLPSGTPFYEAEPLVPVIDWVFQYGLHDRATIMIIPSGSLSNALQQDIKYRANQDNNATAYGAAAQDAQNKVAILEAQGQSPAQANAAVTTPSPIPTNSAAAYTDTVFQMQGVPAVNALARGASPDDSPYKDYNYHSFFFNTWGGMSKFPGGTPVQSADPHPRIATCSWLQNIPYDMIVTIVRQKAVAPSSYATLSSNLQSQKVGSGDISNVQYEPYRKDIYVVKANGTTGMTPQLWFPPLAQAVQLGNPDDVLGRASGFPGLPSQPIASINIPTPDETSGP
jgi:hypothetical protein